MSYRELRNFNEILRALCYNGTPISIESFRTPNFVLVAEVLTWLVKKYDPHAEFPDDIAKEGDRIMFLKSVAQLMYSKARIKLNTRKLYEADGYAVREMLKIGTLLYKAMQSAEKPMEIDGATNGFNDLAKSAQELSRTRQLASEITTLGAQLYDLLGQEDALRDARTNALSRNLDLDEVQKQLKQSLKELEENSVKLNQRMENLAHDESSLTKQIQTKTEELERDSKRLKNLDNVRPAFMEEYERLEVELRRRYEVYVDKFRNVEFLERQLYIKNQEEMQKLAESEEKLKALRARLAKEDLEMMQGDAVLVDDGDGGDDEEFGPAVVAEPLDGRGGRATSAKSREGSRPGTTGQGVTRQGSAKSQRSGSSRGEEGEGLDDSSPLARGAARDTMRQKGESAYTGGTSGKPPAKVAASATSSGASTGRAGSAGVARQPSAGAVRGAQTTGSMNAGYDDSGSEDDQPKRPGAAKRPSGPGSDDDF